MMWTENDMLEMRINSLQNPKVKHLVALREKSSLRRKERLFLVEGVRELNLCLHSDYQVESIFYAPDIFTDSSFLEQVDAPIHSVSLQVYRKIAFREGTEGIVALVREKTYTLQDLVLSANPLIAVLERVEKPGNLGAILRSADAAGVDALIVCDPLVDIHNPQVIRSSVGTVFTVPCVTSSSEECIAFLQKNNIQILTAQLQDSSLYYDVDMHSPVALVFGNEAEGLTNLWRTAANAHIRIPMCGSIDSLNVSVSAAILLFEAVRQRQNFP